MKHFIGGLTVGLGGLAGYVAVSTFGGMSTDHAGRSDAAELPTQAEAPLDAGGQAGRAATQADTVRADTAQATANLTVPAANNRGLAEQAEDAAAWNQIKATNDPSAIAMYLSQSPNGPHAAEAMAYLNELLLPEGGMAVTRGILTPLSPADGLIRDDGSADAETAGASVWTDESRSGPGFSSSDLDTVMTLAALYPPLEGLPESAWQGKVCSECHSLTVTELCSHSKGFMDAAYDIDASSPHPLGVSFKKMLKDWAGKGCP